MYPQSAFTICYEKNLSLCYLDWTFYGDKKIFVQNKVVHLESFFFFVILITHFNFSNIFDQLYLLSKNLLIFYTHFYSFSVLGPLLKNVIRWLSNRWYMVLFSRSSWATFYFCIRRPSVRPSLQRGNPYCSPDDLYPPPPSLKQLYSYEN